MNLPFEKIEREIIVKKDSSTNPVYGCNPEFRPVDTLIDYGVISLNKPSGPTSHQVVDYVKKILNIDKAGHSGTLDPKVTGVLIIATGRATRVVEFLLNAGKEYVCLMHLHKPVEEAEIRKLAVEFTGQIEQLPPVRSAVKRQLRKRNIYYFDILEIDGQDVLFRIGCQAGTYVRKFVHDFGKKLDIGAHMAELVRTKVASMSYDNWVTMHDLKDAYELWKEGNSSQLEKIMQPIENAIGHLPKIWVIDSAVDTLCHGASLSIPGIAKLHSGISRGDYVAVMSLKNELVCIGTALLSSEELKINERGLAVTGSKVFMLPGTYPKFLRPKPAEKQA